MKTLIIIASLVFIGCASPKHKSARSSNRSSSEGVDLKKANQHAVELRFRDEKEQDKKDRARVASRKGMFGPMISAVPQKGGKIEMGAPSSILNNTYKDRSEAQLVAEIKDRYQSGDRIGFQQRAQAFLSRYSSSDSRDEVLYLKGMAELMDKNYGVSLVQFNTILRDHPNGRKAASAMFAKGILFRRMNLEKESRETLGKVLAQFPGSPESVRAKMELKVVR